MCEINIIDSGLKFQIIKEIIDRIYSSVKYIKNFTKIENIKNQNFLSTITISVRSRLDEINGKFIKLAQSSKKRIENQIYINKSKYIFLK